MLIDYFPYFNERELLELRIRLLQDHVDHFVIAEADRTGRADPAGDHRAHEGPFAGGQVKGACVKMSPQLVCVAPSRD
jgi:hypothetical protein